MQAQCLRADRQAGVVGNGEGCKRQDGGTRAPALWMEGSESREVRRGVSMVTAVLRPLCWGGACEPYQWHHRLKATTTNSAVSQYAFGSAGLVAIVLPRGDSLVN